MDTVTTEQGRHCIVLLCGQKGAGKSTLARALVEKYQFVEYAYASALKDLVAAVYQWPRARLDGLTPEDREWREQKDIFWSDFLGREVTPRSELQRIGTDIFRNHLHQDIWVGVVIQGIFNLIAQEGKKSVRVVISDCRFENEIELMIKYHGGTSDFYVFMLQRTDPNPQQEKYKNIIRHDVGTASTYSGFLNLLKEKYPKEHVSEWETTWLFARKPSLFTKLVLNNFDKKTELLDHVERSFFEFNKH